MEEDFLHEWFESINVEFDEAKYLFDLLDTDDEGRIDLMEFKVKKCDAMGRWV